MDPAGSISDAWQACRSWFARADGASSEVWILDIPDGSFDVFYDAVRDMTGIVALLGRRGPESFTPLEMFPDPEDDDDLVLSSFFIGLREGLRLQHRLGPSRPLGPGPWNSLAAGPFDLEISLWPEEAFPGGPAADAPPDGFLRLLDYAFELRRRIEGGRLLLTHGCEEDPRNWIGDPEGRPLLSL